MVAFNQTQNSFSRCPQKRRKNFQILPESPDTPLFKWLATSLLWMDLDPFLSSFLLNHISTLLLPLMLLSKVIYQQLITRLGRSAVRGTTAEGSLGQTWTWSSATDLCGSSGGRLQLSKVQKDCAEFEGPLKKPETVTHVQVFKETRWEEFKIIWIWFKKGKVNQGTTTVISVMNWGSTAPIIFVKSMTVKCDLNFFFW